MTHPATHAPRDLSDPGASLDTARAIAADLAALSAGTPATIAAAQAALRHATDAAENTHAAAEGEARENHLNESRRVERANAVTRRTIRKDHEAKIASATHSADVEISSFERRTKELAEKTHKDSEEREWIADTMAESADQKADQELAAARSLVGSRTKTLADAADAMVPVLKRRGRGAITPEAPDPGTTIEAGAFESIFTRGTEQVATLRSRLESSLHSWILAFAVGISAGLLAFVGLLLAKPNIPADMLPPGGIITLAGATAFALTLLMLIAGWIVRASIPRAAKALARTMGELAASGAAIIKAAEDACAEKKAEAQDRREKELARAAAKRARRKEELLERETVLFPRLKASHESALVALQRARDADLAAHDEQAADALTSLQQKLDASLADFALRRSTALAAARVEFDRALADLRASWASLSRRVAADALAAHASADAACPPWHGPHWPDFAPGQSVSCRVRLGTLSLSPTPEVLNANTPADLAALIPASVSLPLSLDLDRHSSLLILHTADRRADAMRTLNQAMLRVLTAAQPGKVRFTILDPVGLGQNFAAFMHLGDFDPLLVSDRIWTDPRHIEQKLTDLTEHMELVIQKYLRNQYATIQEYNAVAGEVAEPLRFLVMADFPTNLSEAAARRLASIVEAGARCGVYTLFAADLKAKGPPQLPLAEIERRSLTLVLDGATRIKDATLAKAALTLDALPDEERLTAILNRAGTLAKESARVQVPFDAAAPKVESRWSCSSAEDLAVPIGRVGATKLQRLTLGRGTAQHALVAGRTGSGKSTLFHVVITNLALWYSPDEVEFYLIDFKKGVEFKPYATHRLPHARVIAVESEREFGLSVLRGLDAELTRRGVLFRDAGAQDVAAYRAAAASSGGRLPTRMPRVLLVVDEFQEFFVDDDKISQEASLLLDRLVRQGRAFGMHVILGSQTLGGAFGIARSTIGQMGIRIALQSSEQDSYLIMSEDNTAPRLLTRPGEAIYNDASGLVEGNSPFQVVWLSDERREQELLGLRARADAGAFTLAPTIVFEGNAPADIHANHAMLDALRHPAPVAAPRAWLGEAISIKDPTAAAFPRRGGANLLLVGLDEPAAAGANALAMLSLAAQCETTPSPSIYLINGAPEDAGAVLDAAADALGSRASRHGPREAADIITKVADEVTRRAALPHDQADAAPRIFLVVHAMHRLRDLRRSDDFSFSKESATPADKFAAIIREGPSLGVHVIAWVESVTALERAVDRQGLREFGQRLIFQMSATDSTHLIDSPIAANIGRNRAVYFSDETATMEKFRPYAAPSTAWMRHVTGPVREAVKR